MISKDILNKINEVNNKIKVHNKEVEEARALRKIRLEQLKEKCAEYEKEYGVNLYNENLVEMQEDLSKLLAEEEKAVADSLAKAERLLELAESGQYAELNKELGIETEEPVKEEIVDKSVDNVDNSKKVKKSSDSLLGIMEELDEEPEKPTKKVKEISEEVQEELDDIGLDDFFDL